MPADGGEASLLASVPEGIVGGGVFRPVWSPDNTKVLFLANVKTIGDLVSESDVKVIRKLNHKTDGIGFFSDTRVHVFTVDMDDGEPRQLTEGEFDVGAAAWSPDGERIAFVADMSGEADYSPVRDIWVTTLEGGKPERVVEGIVTRGITHLAWSPDGEYIAYTSMEPVDREKLSHRYSNLWVAPSKGGEAVNLTGDFDRSVDRSAGASVAWSPDSETLYFLSPDHGTSHIHRVGIKDTDVERVTGGRMTVQGFSLSVDGSKIAYTATDATHLPELWVNDGSGDRRVTDLTADLVKEIPITEPEEFWFTASDSAEVHGWIMKPMGFDEGVRYPAILQIHGGPWSNYGWAFNLLFQFLSSNGYAVVYVNHRASTGYGEDFSKITGHWGEREYEDLMDAMDYVTGHYSFVDPDRLGVGGCSGGGYLTNWIVTQTDRFRAAVTVASISNWYSFYGCSDLGPCHILSFWDLADGKEPWEEAEAYFRPSPIRYVGNVETPLLIIHGEDDLRCPIEQAEQLFASLMKLRKTTEFVRFPEESHANVHSMKKPSHTSEALRHTLRWYNKYLKDK
jgi:dipeptidyl aminopeptidase/acylaminoacyl peptidase